MGLQFMSFLMEFIMQIMSFLMEFIMQIMSFLAKFIIQILSFLEKIMKGHRDNLKDLKLGVVRLEYNYEAAVGDIDSKESFPYKVMYRIVPGLTFETCQNWNRIGDDDTCYGLDGKTAYTKQEIKNNVHKVLNDLVADGCNAITGDCGFMMWFQASLRSQHLVNVPVMLSSLLQLPGISGCFGPLHEVLILTANSVTLEPMHELLSKECGINTDHSKALFKISGCQNVPGFDAVAKGEKVDVKKVTPHMVQHVLNHIEQNPNTRVILMECTELACYADAVKKATNLPVYDPITACTYLLSGHQYHGF